MIHEYVKNEADYRYVKFCLHCFYIYVSLTSFKVHSCHTFHILDEERHLMKRLHVFMTSFMYVTIHSST